MVCDDTWCAGYGRHEYDPDECPLHTWPPARATLSDAVRYAKPKTMWASWCERCGQFNSASTLRSDVLTDCSFCPPNTLTEAIEYEPVYRPATRPQKVCAKKSKQVRPIRGETTEKE